MAVDVIYTELKNTYNYFCEISVFDVPMLMTVSYNSRSKKRLVSLTSLDGDVLFLKPTYITKGSRVFPNFNATLYDLNFYISLYNYSGSSSEDYSTWANDFQLVFVQYEKFEKVRGWYKASQEDPIEEDSGGGDNGGGDNGGVISCEGALSTVYLTLFADPSVLQDQDLFMSIMGSNITELNGKNIGTTDDQTEIFNTIQQTMADPSTFPPDVVMPTSPIPNGIPIQTIEVANKTNENVRLGFNLTQNNPDSLVVPVLFGRNQAIATTDDKRIARVCLSPDDPCSRATNAIYFDQIIGFWNVEVDGVFHVADSSTVKEILDLNYAGEFEVGQDGWLRIRNITDRNRRFKLIPNVESEMLYSYDTLGNNSFVRNPDNSASFCLSPYEPY